MPGCDHKVQIVRAREIAGESCTLRTLCVVCGAVQLHAFTGEEALAAAEAWFYVPGGLPLMKRREEEGSDE